jgi:hypothetical protein
LGFAQCSTGSTGKKVGWKISSRQRTSAGMPRVFSKTDPGTLRMNSVCDEPGILTRPPKARAVVVGKPGGSICTWACATEIVYSCRTTRPLESRMTVGANTLGMGSS